MRLTIAAALALSCVACNLPQAWQRPAARPRPTYPAPSPEQVAAADIGEPPDLETAKIIAGATLRARLKDPEPIVRFNETIERAFYQEDGKPAGFAWRLMANVNARNSFGGYTGWNLWIWYFRGGTVFPAVVAVFDGRRTFEINSR